MCVSCEVIRLIQDDYLEADRACHGSGPCVVLDLVPDYVDSSLVARIELQDKVPVARPIEVLGECKDARGLPNPSRSD